MSLRDQPKNVELLSIGVFSTDENSDQVSVFDSINAIKGRCGRSSGLNKYCAKSILLNNLRFSHSNDEVFGEVNQPEDIEKFHIHPVLIDTMCNAAELLLQEQGTLNFSFRSLHIKHIRCMEVFKGLGPMFTEGSVVCIHGFIVKQTEEQLVMDLSLKRANMNNDECVDLLVLKGVRFEMADRVLPAIGQYQVYWEANFSKLQSLLTKPVPFMEQNASFDASNLDRTSLGYFHDKFTYILPLFKRSNFGSSCEMLIEVFIALRKLLTVATSSLDCIMILTKHCQGPCNLVNEFCLTAGSIFGLIRTARIEYPKIRFLCIDTDDLGIEGREQLVAQQIQSELEYQDGNDEVVYRNSVRFIPKLQLKPSPLSATNDIRVSQLSGVAIITGGLGGLGLVTAEALVESGVSHIVLVSRSGTVKHLNQGLEQRLEKLQQCEGVTVCIEQCDMGVEQEVVDMLERVRRVGAIKVIVHAAGVLSDGLLVNQTEESMRRVYAPKADGAWYLHQHTLQDEVERFVMFSSPSALFGNRSSCNYAAANSYLDSLAQYRDLLHMPVISVHWTNITDIGMLPSLGVLPSSVSDMGTLSSSVKDFVSRMMNHVDQFNVIEMIYPSGFVEMLKHIPSVSLLNSSCSRIPPNYLIRPFACILKPLARCFVFCSSLTDTFTQLMTQIHKAAGCRMDILVVSAFSAALLHDIATQIKSFTDINNVVLCLSEDTSDMCLEVLKLLDGTAACPRHVFYVPSEVAETSCAVQWEEKGAIHFNIADSEEAVQKLVRISISFWDTPANAKHEISSDVPAFMSSVVIGAGVTGLYVAHELTKTGRECVVLEKSQNVGGVWASQGNDWSRVNTSEPGYRIFERSKSNSFHATKAQVLDDLESLALTFQDKLRFSITVLSLETLCNNDKANFVVHYKNSHTNKIGTVYAKYVFVCVNRRLGSVRRVNLPQENEFKGEIRYGLGNDIKDLSFQGKSVLIVGGGAFASENARTAIEEGAQRVVVLSRRSGTVMPSLMDYLNFVRPYDTTYAHDKTGSGRIFESWKLAFNQCKVNPPECWKEGRLAPVGHSVSVSDLWLVAHYYGLLSTTLGTVHSIVNGNTVVTDHGESIYCDIIIKCTGFLPNMNISEIVQSEKVFTNGVIRKNLCYLAEAVWDDVSSYSNPFGSSYIEAIKFNVGSLLRDLDVYQELIPRGNLQDIMQLSASAYGDFVQSELIRPEIALVMKGQVIHRTVQYHRRCLPHEFLKENIREWDELCMLCESRISNVKRPEYPFLSLLDSLAKEWETPSLCIGGLNSLNVDKDIFSSMKLWVAQCVGREDIRLESKKNVLAFKQSTLAPRVSVQTTKDIRITVEHCLQSMIDNYEHIADDTTPLMELGLDSLASTQLVRMLSKSLELTLPITLIFDYPTVATLTNRLTELKINSTTPLSQNTSIDISLNTIPTVGFDDIAIIGMSCRFPGGIEGPNMFWDVIQSGRSVVGKVPFSRWDCDAVAASDPTLDEATKQRMMYGGFVDDLELFDAGLFRISAAEASAMDPQQRLLLEYAHLAFLDAGHSKSDLQGRNVGVFVGISAVDAFQVAVNSHGLTSSIYTGSGLSHSMAAGRISYVFGLHGPCAAYDTACSSSLVALHAAVRSLQNGDCDLAVVAGVSVMLTSDSAKGQALSGLTSPTGRCHTFDESADGYVRSEGCGVVVLQRLNDCVSDCRSVHAMVRGVGVGQDGQSASLTAPNGRAQEQLIRSTLNRTSVQPSDVDYLEAFGTGSSMGDTIEMHAVTTTIANGTRKSPLLVGGVKANIGHTEAAAGIAGLIKAVLVLQHEEAPPNAELKVLNPKISEVLSEACVRFPIKLESLRSSSLKATSSSLIANVSSFGFSGTISHVVLSQPNAGVAHVKKCSDFAEESSVQSKSSYPWQPRTNGLLQEIVHVNGSLVEYEAKLLGITSMFSIRSSLVEICIAASFRNENYLSPPESVSLSQLRVGAFDVDMTARTLRVKQNRTNGSLRIFNILTDAYLLSTETSSNYEGAFTSFISSALKQSCSREIDTLSVLGLHKVWQCADENGLLALLAIPMEHDHYFVHPQILNAVFCMPNIIKSDISSDWSLVSIESLMVKNLQLNSEKDTLWFYGQIRLQTENELSLDVYLFVEHNNEFTETFLEAKNIRFCTTSKHLLKVHEMPLALRSLPDMQSTTLNYSVVRTTLLKFLSELTKLKSLMPSLSEVNGDATLSELGVDSLGAVGLRNNIFNRFNVFIENRYMVKNPTFADLIAKIVDVSSMNKTDSDVKQDTSGLHHKTAPSMEYVVPLNKKAANYTSYDCEHEMPLYLFHDVTGNVTHLSQIAGLLSISCFGLECDENFVLSLTVNETPIKLLGEAYAKLVLGHMKQLGMNRVSTLRLGGYSYGCRIAYSAVKYLEALGYVVELVLLDGDVHGPITVDMREADKLAINIYLGLNNLSESVKVDSLISIFEGADNLDDAAISQTIGTVHLKPLMNLRQLVRTLAAFTADYRCDYRCGARVIRFTTDINVKDDNSFWNGFEHIEVVPVNGNHFDFFRVDSENVAEKVNVFLSQTLIDANWFSMPFHDIQYTGQDELDSAKSIIVGRSGVGRVMFKRSTINNSQGIDPRSYVRITESGQLEAFNYTLAVADEDANAPSKESMLLILENKVPSKTQSTIEWLVSETTLFGDEYELIGFDKERQEISFTFRCSM